MSHKWYFETEEKDCLNRGSLLTLAINAFSTSPMYSVLHSVLIFLAMSFPFTFDVKNWFRQIRISARWGSFDTRRSRFQRSFRFSNVPHPTLLIFLTRSSPPSWSRHKWISPGDRVLGIYSKAAWRYCPRFVVESESIALKLNIWRECIRPTVYMEN